MTHWSEKYIGMPYDEDGNQCFQFALRVQREVFKRVLDWPELWDIRERSRYIEEEKDKCTLYTENPRDGDFAVLTDSKRPSHAGIVAIIKERIYILHAVRVAGVVRTPVWELARNGGMRVVEYRTWKT